MISNAYEIVFIIHENQPRAHEQAATMVLDRPPTSSGAKASTAATDTNQGSSVRASSQSSEGAVG
jgi:hypothetical protein